MDFNNKRRILITKNIFIIDSRVADYQSLMAA